MIKNKNPLLRARLKKRYSKKQLSDLTGISEVTLWRLELGHTKARPATLANLAKHLDKDISYFKTMEEGYYPGKCTPKKDATNENSQGSSTENDISKRSDFDIAADTLSVTAN